MNTNNRVSAHQLTQLFWLFLAIHVVTWVLVTTFVRHSVSNDIVEVVTWARTLEWGYDKNPWFVAVLARLGLALGGPSAIGIYLIQQLFAVLGLWSIWRLTTALSNAYYGFIACFILEATIYYTLNVQLYNDNYVLLGLWPLSAWFFYQVITRGAWRDWLSLAITLGLAAMAKYDSGILVVAYGSYLLGYQPEVFKGKKLYTAFLLYLLILLPNAIWLWQHQFISLHYAFVARAHYDGHPWLASLRHNAGFVGKVLIDVLPALVALLLSWAWRQTKDDNQVLVPAGSVPMTSLVNRFLFHVALLPFLILLAIALLFGLQLAHEWGMAFIGLWGCYLLLWYQPTITQASLLRFISLIIALLIAWPIGYLWVSHNKKTGDYPGQTIAKLATDTWQAHYHTPLRYVAGSRYVAGYVGLYSPDRPLVFMGWNQAVSPWISMQKLRCHGALFIQDTGHTVMEHQIGLTFPAQVLKDYPTLKLLPPITVAWHDERHPDKPLQVILGILPPDSTFCKQ